LSDNILARKPWIEEKEEQEEKEKKAKESEYE